MAAAAKIPINAVVVATSKKEKPCCEVKDIGVACCLLIDPFVAIDDACVDRMINSPLMGIKGVNGYFGMKYIC
jgi:hypothetical protein